MNDLYVIQLPYAYYGIIVKDGIVINAPPIATWMIKKNILDVYLWVTSKQGLVFLYEEKKG